MGTFRRHLQQKPGRARAQQTIVYVVALAAAMSVPPLLLAIVSAGRWVESERARLDVSAQEMADSALAQVDRYLSGKVAMLQALATSPAIDDRDFRRFDAQARELLDLQGLNIVMRMLDGQQVVNTRLAWGSPLPRVPNYAADIEVWKTHRPRITDLYAGVVARGPLVRVVVPVLRGGEVRYTLTASMSPTTLSRLLSEAGVSAPQQAFIADRQGTVVAEIASGTPLTGKPMPGFDATTGEWGAWSGIGAEGGGLSGTYRRSSLSGWIVAVGIDRQVLDAPLHRSILLLLVIAAALGTLGVAASLHVTGRLLKAQDSLVEAAEALGRGEAVAPLDTSLREANRVGEALATASLQLRRQAAALRAANHDLEGRVASRTRELSAHAALFETTLDNMTQGLMVIDAGRRVPICNRRAMELLDLPASLMESNPTFVEVLRFQLGRDEFARSGSSLRAWVEGGGIENDPHIYERERPNGMVLEIRTVPLPIGGAVRTYTDVTERRRGEALAHRMARQDPLTKLPNRTLFLETLEATLAQRTQPGGFAVLLLDLDRFKTVNDTFGHPVGDELLIELSRRVREAAEAGDTVARLAGDEFAILQTSRGQPLAAIALARRLAERIARPFDLETCRIEIGVSIGIAVGRRDGDTSAQLLKNADMALYRAKQEGRNTFRFFEAGMDLAAQLRRSLELDLRRALAQGEFDVFYQPIVATADRSTSGFEALLRWRHPERGLIAPSDFIPLAEDTRLIVPIGAWTLRQACREAASWPGRAGVSVNISAVQFGSGDLVGTVAAALAETGLAPERLELEITESVVMENTDAVFSSLRRLRELGVRLALDDFGTGYSSLSYLHAFSFDRIKIDRSFVNGSDDPTMLAILRTVIGLATRLGAAVTAEGVETWEQFDLVSAEGCSEVQGFLFSQPVPAVDARRLGHRDYMREAA